MSAALKRGVETGSLVKVKNSYKVSAAEKAKKRPAAKTTAAKKKAATKTKVRCAVKAVVFSI